MDNLAPASDSSIQSARIDSHILAPQEVPEGANRVSVEQLLLAGAHFGHLKQRWNPKMKPYIFSSRNGIYLLDLNKTSDMLEVACKEITKIAGKGESVLFVGTKKQARDVIQEEADRAGCPFVTYRWLGGMLTNHTTIRRSLKTLETFDQMSTDGTYEKLTKKEQLSINKLRTKLERTLGGIKDMRRLPGAVFVIDTRRESIAVAEARKLDIPVFAIVDTNVDPDKIDYKIPANDDAFKSIWLILRTIADAILEGKAKRKDFSEVVSEDKKPRETKGKARRPRKRRQRSDAPKSDDSSRSKAASTDMQKESIGNKPPLPVVKDDSAGNVANLSVKIDESAGNIAAPSVKIDDSAGNISSTDDKQTTAKGNIKEPTNEPG